MFSILHEFSSLTPNQAWRHTASLYLETIEFDFCLFCNQLKVSAYNWPYMKGSGFCSFGTCGNAAGKYKRII